MSQSPPTAAEVATLTLHALREIRASLDRIEARLSAIALKLDHGSAPKRTPPQSGEPGAAPA